MIVSSSELLSLLCLNMYRLNHLNPWTVCFNNGAFSFIYAGIHHHYHCSNQAPEIILTRLTQGITKELSKIVLQSSFHWNESQKYYWPSLHSHSILLAILALLSLSVHVDQVINNIF